MITRAGAISIELETMKPGINLIWNIGMKLLTVVAMMDLKACLYLNIPGPMILSPAKI